MTSPPVPPQATAMCECSHHWRMHAESGYTSNSRPCHGTTGSATPGPYQPCNCQGFAPWGGPRDARTGEPVRPLMMTVDARQQPSAEPVLPQAITAEARATAIIAIAKALVDVASDFGNGNHIAGDALKFAEAALGAAERERCAQLAEALKDGPCRTSRARTR